MHNIDDILAKHFSGLQLTDDEEKLFASWQLTNNKEFEALRKTMAEKQTNSYELFNTSKGWDKMAARIDKPYDNKVFTLKPFLKYAAAASIALLVGLLGLNYFNSESLNMIVFENKTSGIDSLLLPDGSQIFLAQNSKVEYVESFNEKRNLKLEGEAFFDVQKNKAKPFTVETDHGLITVLGTSFNINAQENRTQVDVKTGLVSLSRNSLEVKLSKNETAWSDGRVISQKTVTNPNFLAWKTGEFYFENTPFDEVVKFLESFYGDVIELEPSIVKECQFTGTFKNENIDEIIEALILSCNLEFSKENNRIILK